MRVGLLGIALAAAFFCGCDSGKSSPDNVKVSTDQAPPTTVDAHEHPTEGPHHGTLVELGKEEYHAEVVHSKDSVTVYILDSKAKSASPIDAAEVVINVVHEGQPEQFKLPPSPEAGETDGKSSRYTSNDPELAAHIDDEAAAPKLSLSIGGKPYRGEIHHDHDGHDHDHGHAH